jgi:hypothetical protein
MMKAMILYFMSDTHKVLAKDILWFTFFFARHQWPSLPFASRNVTETQDADFVWWFAQIYGLLLHTSLLPLLGADEVSA